MSKPKPEAAPAPPVDDPAEQRAHARRETERQAEQDAAEKEAQRMADDAAAAVALEKERVKLRAAVLSQKSDAIKFSADARELAAKFAEEIKRLEAAAGDLDGAVLTAGDLARHDPARALASLQRGCDAFRKIANGFKDRVDKILNPPEAKPPQK